MSPEKPLQILLLAPHPFYQERGTPIAVDLLLQALSRRGAAVEVLTFHEGEARAYPGVTLHRIPRLPFLRGIRPGFSLKKLVADAFLLARALGRVRRRRPDVVHAVEESVFIALLLRALFGVPYVYDMDSSLAGQMVEKLRFLAPLAGVLRACERLAFRHALAVVPVCDALADLARAGGARRIVPLRDIPLLPDAPLPAPPPRTRGVCFMYVGNLEPYQGADLLLEAFARAAPRMEEARLVIVGGPPALADACRRRAVAAGLGDRVECAGPRPTRELAELFRRADVLVSPRTRGINTPMKIYSYLVSGRPILATDLPTHTQVLTPDAALLAPPTPAAWAEAMTQLAGDPGLRARLAERAADLARRRYSRAAFDESVATLCGVVAAALTQESSHAT